MGIAINLDNNKEPGSACGRWSLLFLRNSERLQGYKSIIVESRFSRQKVGLVAIFGLYLDGPLTYFPMQSTTLTLWLINVNYSNINLDLCYIYFITGCTRLMMSCVSLVCKENIIILL